MWSKIKGSKECQQLKRVGKQSVLVIWDTQYNAAVNFNIVTSVADTPRQNSVRRQKYFSGGTISASPPHGLGNTLNKDMRWIFRNGGFVKLADLKAHT